MANKARLWRRPFGMVLCSLLVLVGLPVVFAGPAAAAPCPAFGPLDHWIGGYTVLGSPASYFSEADIASGVPDNSGIANVSGQITSINGSAANPNTIVGVLQCSNQLIYGAVDDVLGPNTQLRFVGFLSGDGNQISSGQWQGFGPAGILSQGTFSSARVIRSVQVDDTHLTTDPGATGATPTEPLQVEVTSPTTGHLAAQLGTSSNPVLDGYQLLNQVVHITAPTATPDAPLEFQFTLDSSTLLGAPAGEVQVFRNGALVENCAPDAGAAAVPNPCVASRVALAGGDVQITVRTAAASIWSFGVNPSRLGLRVWTSALPQAHVGQAYTSTLTGLGGTAPYRWKKIGKLPKGLKLKAKTGVISGTPKVTGTFTAGIQVKDNAKPNHVATKTITITIA